MPVTDVVKEKIVGFLGLIVVLIAVVQMLPTLQTALANVTGVPVLNFALIGTLVGVGLLIFVVESVI